MEKKKHQRAPRAIFGLDRDKVTLVKTKLSKKSLVSLRAAIYFEENLIEYVVFQPKFNQTIWEQSKTGAPKTKATTVEFKGLNRNVVLSMDGKFKRDLRISNHKL